MDCQTEAKAELLPSHPAGSASPAMTVHTAAHTAAAIAGIVVATAAIVAAVLASGSPGSPAFIQFNTISIDNTTH